METSGSRQAAEALRFRIALDQLNARGARALRLRFVSGASRAEAAAFFGISRAAFDVMLLRGARELRARLDRANPPERLPSDADEEPLQAQLLGDSLESEIPLSAELAALRSTLAELALSSGEIRAQDAQAALEEQSSPRHRRRLLLWRALLLAMVGAALFLYFRPRPPPRVLSRVPAEQLR